MTPIESSLLLTDLYQLTMLEGYFRHGMNEVAVFDLFVRKLPPARSFLLAAGLEQLLDWLEHARVTSEELDALRATRSFDPRFLDHLGALRFTGDVDAMPEGTVFFPDEPVVRVTAPLMEAQLVEPRLINLVHFQTVVASKAARSVLAAPGKLLVEFGLRRAHGAEAALLAARASYVAGMAGTSNVLAGMRFGIPTFGTMAHSFVQAHDDEAEAFRHFARDRRERVVLLLDTYDTEAAAEKVVAIAPGLAAEGIRIDGVRLDSGDLAEHARRVRRILDDGGLRHVTIFASGSQDEGIIHALLAAGAPIDGFGIGTRLDTSADAPSLDCAYKLTEYAGIPRRKRSEGKGSWPGRRQVFRRRDAEGTLREDVLTIESDPQVGEPLLRPVMRAGRRVGPSPSLAEIRARAAAELAGLPPALRGLEPAPPFRVRIAPALLALAAEVDARTAGARRPIARRDPPPAR
jgi:nicotinate phosphoribosyltransferase